MSLLKQAGCVSDLDVSSDDLQHLSSVPEHVGAHDSTAQHALPGVGLLSGQRLHVLLQTLAELLKLAL